MESFTLAHLSDLHCGSPHFVPDLMERAIAEINDLKPDIVVCSGDLTTFGFKEEFAEAKRYLSRLDCDATVVVPGNHDSRNVGYLHFEELFGDRNSVRRVGGVTVVAVDSTEPDLDHGQIGRGRYRWIEEQFADASELRIFVLHHHLLPVPGTGRERAARQQKPFPRPEHRLVGHVHHDVDVRKGVLERVQQRHAVVDVAAQLLRPAREPGADHLVRQRGDRVAHDRRVVLPVDNDDRARHRRDVTSPSIRAVYFSNSSVSVANWMIFSWPWNGYLRQTSTCVPENSITL